MFPKVALVVALSATTLLANTNLVTWQELGLRVAPGFKVALFADGALADNCQAMTLNAKGEVVVTGPGYIRTLHDRDRDGRADASTHFATTRTGGMGLCFDGSNLLFMGDGAFSMYRDANNDGVADGPGELIRKIATGEHGGHAMRKGPDGFWYFMGGNDAKFWPEHATKAGALIRAPDGGAVLRLSPDFKESEFILQGLRNPYDFDFNAYGDLFTYDSDVERDYLLPWYTPTRMYHLAVGAHHGWRLPGYLRSWKRPDYYADTAEQLTPVGRGSPTGVAVCRHLAFPAHYQNGVFALDWTFGNVWFFPLEISGASYQGKGELFLEPIGSEGFAPNDIAIGPDGSIYVSIGGRKTRGAVFRITPTTATPVDALTGIEKVLRAPQPLDAWSRAEWMPLARDLGAAAFLTAAQDSERDALSRIRAIEVHRELFGPLPVAMVSAAREWPPKVRARVAWAAPRSPALWRWAADKEPWVQRAALERLLELGPDNGAWPIETEALLTALGSNQKRVALAAIELAVRADEKQWAELWERSASASRRSSLHLAIAQLRRPAAPVAEVVQRAVRAFEAAREDELRLAALRVVMLAGGDWNLHKPSVEIYTAYELPNASTIPPKERRTMLQAISSRFPFADVDLNTEAARVLAMLEDEQPETIARIASQLAPHSSPIDEFHYLIVLSKMRARWPEALAAQTAATILTLEKKLSGRERRIKQNWTLRLTEVTRELIRREPALESALVNHPEFVTEGRLAMVDAFSENGRRVAALRFRERVERDKAFPWSPALVQLLGSDKSAARLLREHTDELALRDALVMALAPHASSEDRSLFVAGLKSSQSAVIAKSLDALSGLEGKPYNEEKAALAVALKRTAARKPDAELNQRLARRARVLLGEPSPALSDPELLKALAGEESASETMKLVEQLDAVNSSAERGRLLYESRACQSCHNGPSAVGPDLTGISGRLSRSDLFREIILPNQNLSDAFRPTTFELKNGQTQSGMIAFESADGVIIQTGPGTTVRLNDDDILSRSASETSLMPEGLLDGLTAAELADLYAYMKTL